MKIVIEIPGDPSATAIANCASHVAAQVRQGRDHGLVRTFGGTRADWHIEREDPGPDLAMKTETRVPVYLDPENTDKDEMVRLLDRLDGDTVIRDDNGVVAVKGVQSVPNQDVWWQVVGESGEVPPTRFAPPVQVLHVVE